MDGIDLNISNYSTLELFALIGANTNTDVFSLKTLVQNKYKQLRSISGMTDDDREKLLIFIHEVYQKLLEHIKIQKENELLALDELKTLRVSELTEHKPMETIATFPQKYAAGVINPLEKRTITKIVNIDSLFRVNFYTTNSNSFDIVLPAPIKNVLSMKVTSLELPKCVYVFNVLNKTNQFQIVIDDCCYLIEVREGNYTGEELVTYLNDIVFPFAYSGALVNIVASYDPKYERIVFSSSVDGFEFGLDFTVPEYPNRSVTLNMGWIIGFRKPCYNYSDDYYTDADMSHDVGFNADACYTGNVFRYLFLSVNEFKNNYNDAIIPVFTNVSTLTISNVLAILRYDLDRGMIVSGNSADTREYFGPVSIEKLKITLYDEFGRLAPINCVDYSFQLELECLYNL
jgi:hypothetical protein